MAKHYSAYMLRYWQLDNASERVEIRHINSDATTRVNSLDAAIVWLREHSAATQSEPATSDNDTTTDAGQKRSQE